MPPVRDQPSFAERTTQAEEDPTHGSGMRRPTLAAAGLLMLSASFLAPSIPAAGEGVALGWEETLHIDSGLAGAQKEFEAFDTASLNLYDFNGDGQLEIVSNNDNNRIYVIDSKSGRVLAEIPTIHPGDETWPVRELNPIAIGDLYGDGVPCLVAPSSAGFLAAWCFDAAASTATKLSFTKKWDVRMDAADFEPDFQEEHPWLYDENGTRESWPAADGHAFLADVDGDGKQEVFAETDGYPGQFAFNHDGSYRWSRSFSDGNGGAQVIDIDGDGQKEAVFVGDSGLVVAYTAASGKIEWVFESADWNATPGSIPVAPLVADLHGDGLYETVFGTRGAVYDKANPNWINESHATYFALDHKGRVLWSARYDWMNPLQYNHPAPADVNGDGVLDVLFLDWNTIGHKPGNWETTNRPANLFALDGTDGSEIWHTPITVYWSNKDFVIADADGDGDQDVIAPTAKGGSDGLGVYDLETGERTGWFGFTWQASRGPVAGDLYGDGKLYLVVPVAHSRDEPNYRSLDVGYREGALKIIRTNVAYDATFSANILWTDEVLEAQPTGTSGASPTPPAQPTQPTSEPPAPQPPTDVAPPPAPTAGAAPTPGSPAPATSPSGSTSPPVTNVTMRGPSPSEPEESSIPGITLGGLLAAAGLAVLVAARSRR